MLTARHALCALQTNRSRWTSRLGLKFNESKAPGGGLKVTVSGAVLAEPARRPACRLRMRMRSHCSLWGVEPWL